LDTITLVINCARSEWFTGCPSIWEFHRMEISIL